MYVQIVGPSVKFKNKKVTVCNGSFLNEWYRVGQFFARLEVTLCAYVSPRDSLGGSKGGYAAQKNTACIHYVGIGSHTVGFTMDVKDKIYCRSAVYQSFTAGLMFL